ncbi:MAG: cupin domain-containing protein [Clostridiales bacterium]|nr:cupin domain-containing protein [Clostridiales bacterium]
MIDFLWNNVMFNITDIGGGILSDDIPRHAHSSDSYELHFITGGHGTLYTDTNNYTLKKGDFFITGPNVHHSQTTDKSSPVKDVFIMFEAVKTNKKNIISSVFLSTDFYYSENFENEIPNFILSEYREKKPDYKTAVSGLSIKMLTDITRMLLPEDFKDISSGDTLNDRRFIIIEQSFLYSPDLTLSELSHRIGLCERQTQRLLKKYYGKSFREKKKEKHTAYL